MRIDTVQQTRILTPACLLLLCILAGPRAGAQGVDVAGRPVAAVRVTGVSKVDPQFVLNQVRTQAGRPYDPAQVARDIRNITRLGRFASVRAEVTQRDDGAVVLTFVVDEQPLLADVQVVGNKRLDDQKLLESVLLRGGDPLDPFLIDRGVRQIRESYREAGYYLADVSVDEQTLDESNVLIFRVREGPRVKVREVAYEGNEQIAGKQLDSKIKTDEYFVLFSKGSLSEEELDRDVARIRDFYGDRGYLDARVGRRIELSDDQKDARVTFVIDEGVKYTVGDVRFRVEGKGVYSEAMLREAMPLKSGDVFSSRAQEDSVEAIEDLYGELGYLPPDAGGDTRVAIERLFDPEASRVHLLVLIAEGRQYTVGNVIIRGNATTQDRVFRRQLRRVDPGRPYDNAGLNNSVQRVRGTGLVGGAKITVQGQPDDPIRDALVEVQEQRTGSISFGAALSSDAGILGAFDLRQRNFDIADLPESTTEFITGKAFSGAGQQFGLSIQPGDELQRYSISWSDPYVFDSDYFLSLRGQYFTRVREQYDEERLGGFTRFGKRFGDIWSATVNTRFEGINIDDVDSDAPVDVFDVEGDSTLMGLGLSVARSTVDSRIFPTRGTRLVAGVEHVGFGGDFDFTRFSAEGNAFFTIDQDFYGRKTVLGFNTQIGYIFPEGDAPTFERFYAGGHSSFRGFEFRGVGPRGVRADTLRIGDDPVGGSWLFLLGAEYNYPIWGTPAPDGSMNEIVRGVFFVDSGTVREDIGLGEYRVSVGAGVRLKLPFLGQAPFAFDLAYPVLKEDADETRIFSFSLAVPF